MGLARAFVKDYVLVIPRSPVQTGGGVDVVVDSVWNFGMPANLTLYTLCRKSLKNATAVGLDVCMAITCAGV